MAAEPNEPETVLLLHGVNGVAGEWHDLARALPPRLRGLAIDLPGHGAAQTADFGLDACVEAVVEVLREVGAAHLVGSSFGGGVALAVAARHPGLVRTVTTIGTGPGGERELFDLIAPALREQGPAAFFAATIPTYSYPPGTDPAVIERAVARAGARSVDEALAVLETAFCTDLRPEAGRVTVPRLILGGAEDRTSGPDRVRALAEAASAAPCIVEGFAHLPHLENPERLAALLAAFWAAPVDPLRTTSDLDALHALSHDGAGVQRVAWTPVWRSARELFCDRAREIPGVRLHQDAAGNNHATLQGAGPGTLVLGSHLDSVPDGGNLDGGYGVLAALEVLRALAGQPTPPTLSVRVTDWADEEGARFGRSLFGSAAVTGALDVAALRGLRDQDGATAADVLSEYGVDLERLDAAHETMTDVVSYLELHIEQGPVLDEAGEHLAAVTGSLGVERHRVTVRGTASHAGSPLALRHDPVAAVAAFLLAARRIAVARDGLVTCGILEARPATPTAVPETVTLSIDARHDDADELSALWGELESALVECCLAESVQGQTEPVWRTAPVGFDPGVVDLAAAVVRAATGGERRLVSGPLHDACEMSRAGVPTAMLFVPSIGGISHAPGERTAIEDLHAGVRALAALTARVLEAAEAP